MRRTVADFPCRRGAGFDHGLSLRRHPKLVDRCLIPDRFAVFLHLEANLWAEAHAFSVASPFHVHLPTRRQTGRHPIPFSHPLVSAPTPD